MAATPTHPLSEVKRLVNAYLQNGDETVWFSAASRSTGSVSSIYPQLSAEQVVRFILEAILTLAEPDFCSSNLQWGDSNLIADVYGVIYDNKPWFVKFLIENDCLEEISFHPPEKPMKTIGGKLIPAGAKP